MSEENAVKELQARLDGVLESLLHAVGGSRCTLRIDDDGRGWHVDFICAEATLPGVKSLRNDGSIDQRAADTVRWLALHKRNLVQPDLTISVDPKPPAALMSAYAAKAQMLAPLLDRDGELGGWVSVHYTDGPRPLSAQDEAVLNRAAEEVAGLTGLNAAR